MTKATVSKSTRKMAVIISCDRFIVSSYRLLMIPRSPSGTGSGSFTNIALQSAMPRLDQHLAARDPLKGLEGRVFDRRDQSRVQAAGAGAVFQAALDDVVDGGFGDYQLQPLDLEFANELREDVVDQDAPQGLGRQRLEPHD